jgi:hypothetical protein
MLKGPLRSRLGPRSQLTYNIKVSTSIVRPFLYILVTAVFGLEADSPSDAEELQLLAYELQDQFENVHRRSDH